MRKSTFKSSNLQLLFHNSQYCPQPFPRLARMSRISSTQFALLGGLFFLLVFVAQGIFFIRANSQTVDEVTHLAAGYSYLARRDFPLNPGHTPLTKELQALPLFLSYK